MSGLAGLSGKLHLTFISCLSQCCTAENQNTEEFVVFRLGVYIEKFESLEAVPSHVTKS